MKRSKYRIFAVLCAVMLCMAAFSQVAFAASYESDESGDSTPPDAIDSIQIDTEAVPMPSGDGDSPAIEWDVDATEMSDLMAGILSALGGSPLTPDGNLTLIDDIYQVESYSSDESELKDKQFITVQTKNGNYFYIVIDRSGDTENVYFLNMVDEADLMALMEDGNGSKADTCTCTDKCVAGDVNTACPVCKSNMSECVGKEKEPVETKPDDTADPDTDPDADSEKSGSKTGVLLVVLVIALAGGGALYWFKFRKPKADTKGSADLDDYDYGEEDDEQEYEFEKDDADEDMSNDKDEE